MRATWDGWPHRSIQSKSRPRAQLQSAPRPPVDIWVTCHARWWGRYRKFVVSAAAKDAVEPFIDPEGYHAYIDAAEAELAADACTKLTCGRAAT